MRGSHWRWFLRNDEGWSPRFYEAYFGTPLGAAIRKWEEQAVFDMLGVVMEPSHRVLEVGSGTGNFTVPVARRCTALVSVDSASEMRRYLGKRIGRERLANVEIVPGRLPDKLVSSGTFDGALAIGVLNYVKGLADALRALVSAVRPAGWLIFTVPLTTVEGRIYALTELVNRRRVSLYSLEETTEIADSVRLRVETIAVAGFSRGGLTLVVGGRTPGAPAERDYSGFAEAR